MQSFCFTVVIPTFNRADLLPLAIDSVLQQSCQDFEIIVVDNFSSDNTPQVMQRYTADERIRYFRNERNMERGYSRNVGFRNAKGEFLTLLDSDDVMYASCLQDAFEYSKQHSSKKVFHNLYEMIDQQGRPSKKMTFAPIIDQYRQICRSNFLSCIGVFLHREVYQNYRFSEDLKMIGSEDYEIWFRILAHYQVGRIEKVNCGIREHVGRSVYSSMYENLEYQRCKLIEMIESDPVLRSTYGDYIGYINANYFYHQAMYSLHKRRKKAALQQFSQAIFDGKGFVLSRRFPGFVKNFVLTR